MATLIKLGRRLVKGRRSHQPLPGSRPEHEIRREVERDLQKWRDRALQEAWW